jgi:hypothetical protein
MEKVSFLCYAPEGEVHGQVFAVVLDHLKDPGSHLITADIDIHLLLHCGYPVVTLLSQCCYTVVTLLLHCCYC